MTQNELFRIRWAKGLRRALVWDGQATFLESCTYFNRTKRRTKWRNNGLLNVF